MAITILQLWEDLVGDQIAPVEKKRKYSYRKRKFIIESIRPSVSNEKFINTVQISNWQDFTSRSIAPNRKNPASELNSTWAPEGKIYFE